MSEVGAAASNTRNVGRNDPCPCRSGLKFKHCCQSKAGGARQTTTPRKVTHVAANRGTSQSISGHLGAVKRLGEAGRWTEAIIHLREIARLDPDSSAAHHDLGVTILRCGRPAEAAVSLQRAVELRPGF